MEKSGKQELIELENQNKYVFHGSGFLIEEFEPRQAYNYIEGQNVPDRKPAIFASSFANYAIFMALINEVNCPKGYNSGSRFHEGKLVFRATKETLEQLKAEVKGYVYVFNSSDFLKQNESEWVSYKKVKPILVISVTRSDFTPTIKEVECTENE